MNIGLTSPIMEPDVDRELFRRWAELVDAGPFSTFAFGERIAFPNPHVLTILTACAAWTKRVGLTTTVIAAPLYDPVMLAKELASIDLIAEGRLSVGLGVGGRTEDYVAVNADLGLRTQESLRRFVDTMRRTWAGERVREGAAPIGPFPDRAGGIPLLSGAMGPKAIRASAAWAETVTGFSMNADPRDVERTFELTRSAWRDAGRPAPRLVTSFWYALGDRAREQVDAHLKRYLAYHGPEVERTLSTLGFAGSARQLRTLLRQIEDLGCDEVLLTATASDPAQISRVADLIG